MTVCFAEGGGLALDLLLLASDVTTYTVLPL